MPKTKANNMVCYNCNSTEVYRTDSDDDKHKYMIVCESCGWKYYYWGKRGAGGIE